MESFNRRHYLLWRLCWGIDPTTVDPDYFDQDSCVRRGRELFQHLDDTHLQDATFFETDNEEYFEWNKQVPFRVDLRDYGDDKYTVQILNPKDYSWTEIKEENASAAASRVKQLLEVILLLLFFRYLMSHLKQRTLDGTPYIERNRLGQPVKRIEKQKAGDYVLAVFGPTKLREDAWVSAQLAEFVRRDRRSVKPLQVILGDGPGVSTSAILWADGLQISVRLIDVEAYLEKWPRQEFGNLAYAKRDQDVIDLADVVVVLWDKKQKTTPQVVTRAQELGKLAHIVYLREEEGDA